MFGRRARIGIFVGLAALAVLASEILLGVRAVSPPPGSAVGPGRETLEIQVTGLPLTAELHVDGRPVPTDIRWAQGLVVARTGPLAEGEHVVELHLQGVARTLRRHWAVRMDYTPPPLAVWMPEVVARREATLKGKTERGAAVRVNRELTFHADPEGSFAAPIPLRPGWNDLEVVALDAAANEKKHRGRIFCDLEAPELRIEQPADASVVKTCAPAVQIASQDAGGLACIRFRLDEGQWLPVKSPDLRKFTAPALAEGQHSLEVEVQDRAAWTAVRKTLFTIDSSETFGERELGSGAVGKDVRELQRRLSKLGLLPAKALSGHLAGDTLLAVEAFQKREGLALSGLADRATLIALGPRVYISLAHFSLVLDEPGVPLRRFPIAHGTDQYPTPTGSFTVIEKVPDPTWLPPDSPWAEGVEPVPPGPGNPLGTRWIGLTGGMVGIHGTSSPGSIGSRASHGCVRMYVSDVERLYEMVKVGTPVTIFGGWESSKELQKYWN